MFFEITKASGVPWRTEAAMWAVAMLENGDLDGDAAWKRILRAVEGLQGAAPKSGEAVHGLAAPYLAPERAASAGLILSRHFARLLLYAVPKIWL